MDEAISALTGLAPGHFPVPSSHEKLRGFSVSVVRRDQSFRFDRLKKKEYVMLAQDVLSFMKLAFSICRMKLRTLCVQRWVEVTQRQVQ
jgi:hypothetical protein